MAGYYANYGPNAYNAGTSEDENKQYDTASTPVDNQLYDYSQQAQPAADNPYATAGATTDTSSFDTTPTQEQAPQETTPQQPQTTAEMTQAAAEANSNTQQALQDTLTAWGNQNNISTSRMTEMQQFQSLTPEQKQIVLAYEQKNNPDNYNSFLSDWNRYNQYASSLTTSATPAATPAPSQAPAQETAPQQNPILPSAGGNYQADSIYDPSKTYGRQPDGSYVYSSSAAQLQRDLNRTMNAGLAVDGYFGTETQKALDAYLSQYGKNTTPASTAATAETPISQNGSMSAALAASAAEAPEAPATSSGSGTSKSGHDDAWYAEQYEKITGSAPRTDILSPERIRDFVDKEMAKAPVTPEDEGYDAMLQQQALYEQAQEQQRLNEMNERRDEAFTPKFIDDLRNGKSVEQILGEGDLSYNRWIQDNWDDLSYTYNLGSESPFESQPKEQREPINYAAMLDELNQMDRNDWYQRPESQATTQREPINYNAMADELAQLERNDWYQRPESQSASAPERTPINYDAMSNELFQMDRNDWYQRPETPQAPERTPLEYSDAFIRQQDMNDAYSPRQSYNNNYMAELERLQEPQVNETPQARQPLEYSDAFIRQEEMRDAYSPNQTFNDSYREQLERMQEQEDTTNPDTVSSDDIQATASTTPRASQVGDSMSRALADNQARPDTNIFRQDVQETPPVVSPQREEQYKTLFGNEMAALKEMYPDASYSQLYDYLRLFYEQNGDTNTEYYRWFNSFL